MWIRGAPGGGPENYGDLGHLQIGYGVIINFAALCHVTVQPTREVTRERGVRYGFFFSIQCFEKIA